MTITKEQALEVAVNFGGVTGGLDISSCLYSVAMRPLPTPPKQKENGQ